MLWWFSLPLILNKSPTVSPSSTPTPSHLLLFTVGTSQESIHSPFLRRTKTRSLEPKISNLDLSDQRADFHWSNVHSLCFLAQTNQDNAKSKQ